MWNIVKESNGSSIDISQSWIGCDGPFFALSIRTRETFVEVHRQTHLNTLATHWLRLHRASAAASNADAFSIWTCTNASYLWHIGVSDTSCFSWLYLLWWSLTIPKGYCCCRVRDKLTQNCRGIHDLEIFWNFVANRWTFGIVEPWFSCYIRRWLPKCGFFNTAPGRFWKGGLRGRLLVFLKSETRRGRLYVFSFMVPVKVMSHVKKKRSSPNPLLPPHVFEYTLGVTNRVELKRFNQSR